VLGGGWQTCILPDQRSEKPASPRRKERRKAFIQVGGTELKEMGKKRKECSDLGAWAGGGGGLGVSVQDENPCKGQLARESKKKNGRGGVGAQL